MTAGFERGRFERTGTVQLAALQFVAAVLTVVGLICATASDLRVAAVGVLLLSLAAIMCAARPEIVEDC